MKQISLKKIPLRANPFSGWALRIDRILFALFALQLMLVWLNLWAPFHPFGRSRWPDGLLIVLATATTLASLTRRLPGQNVILASFIIIAIAAAAQTLGALAAIPFGPYLYTENFGQMLFYPLPWAAPLLWVVAILTSRGVGRLILRPWRKTKAYGFWLMGLTVGLVVLLDFGLEPFATQVKHFWLWGPSKAGLYWYTTPWVNFLGWAATAAVILAFTTPALINKKPAKQPTDYKPLVVWLLVNMLFVTAALVHQLWWAAGLTAAASVAVTIFAIRGARW